ncbi:MAG: tail tape measure protein, partial [Novosphingobium sp.]
MNPADSGPIESLLIDVRANTQGFAADIAAMRGTFDGTLVDGFSRAGEVLERGLLSAIRKGSLGFEDLQRIALRVVDDIAARALDSLFDGIGGGGSGSGAGGGLGGL